MLELFFSKRESANTAELLSEIESTVENNLKAAISRFQNMPDDELLKPAADGGWSIAQCLEHLNFYSRYYIPAIEGAMNRSSDNLAATTYKSSRLGHVFTKMMKPESKLKLKATGANNPERNLNAHEVVAEFIRHQENMLAVIRRAASFNLSAIRIPISISKAVRLPLGDVLQFIAAHDDRHIQQAMRNMC